MTTLIIIKEMRMTAPIYQLVNNSESHRIQKAIKPEIGAPNFKGGVL